MLHSCNFNALIRAAENAVVIESVAIALRDLLYRQSASLTYASALRACQG